MPLHVPILVPAIRLDRDAAAEAKLAFERARQPWLAGFIVFGGEADDVAALTERLRHAAGRPIFIGSDMERGAGQQIQGLTQLPDAGLIGLAGTPEHAYRMGRMTATEARSVGIDVIFAPCLDVRSALDNPILGNRSFGFDAGRVADLGTSVIGGIKLGGALAVAKHFPGHGATRVDSHETVPVVEEAADVLAARDMLPFEKALWWAECPGVMTAHVAYPALDPSGAIATFSKPIVDRAHAIAHPESNGPVVFTDALLMAGATVDGGEPEAARRALEAGCDVLLYPEEPEAVAAAIEAAPDVERAARNVAWFTARAAAAAPEPDDGDGEAAAADVARRALAMAGWPQAGPGADALLVVDDDGIENRGAVLKRAAADCGLPCEIVRVPDGSGPVLERLQSAWGGKVPVQRAVVVFASARAWKGTSGVSRAGRELVARALERMRAQGEVSTVLWCAPRVEDWRDCQVPGSGPHLERAIVEAVGLGPDA